LQAIGTRADHNRFASLASKLLQAEPEFGVKPVGSLLATT
jgi:hypothetical protein